VTTVTFDPPERDAEPPAPARHWIRWVVLAVVAISIVKIVLLVWWFRRGGAKDMVRELAEEGAVILADKAVEELFGT